MQKQFTYNIETGVVNFSSGSIVCPRCNLTRIVKAGTATYPYGKVQVYYCHNCKKTFQEQTPEREQARFEKANKMRERMKGSNSYFYGKHLTGKDNPFFGKHHTEETKEKLRELNRIGTISRKGQKNTPEHNAKISATNKITYAKPENRARLVELNRRKAKDPEWRRKVSESLTGIKRTPEQIAAWKERMDKWIEEHGYPHTRHKLTGEQRENLSLVHKGTQYTEKQRIGHQRQIEKMKELWKDPEWRNMLSRKAAAGAQRRPTTTELKMEMFLNHYFPNQYKYSGDGTEIIGGLIPDFIDTNGNCRVIEIFGDFWHSPRMTGMTCEQEEQDKIDRYEDLGFKCLIIWERELDIIIWDREIEEAALIPLINKVTEFNKA